MIEGSVSAVGRAIVVALVATDCNDGSTIARDQVEVERKEDVLKARRPHRRRRCGDRSASRAARSSGHNVPIEEATTAVARSAEGLHGRGRAARGRQRDRVRSPFFERAISLDPNFALAYTTLSSIYGGLGETGRERGIRAARLRAQRHASASASGSSSSPSTTTGSPAISSRRATRSKCGSRRIRWTTGRQRARGAAQPARRVRPVDRRSAGRHAAQPRARLPVLEPRLRLPRRRPVRRREADREAGGGDGDRDHADPPPAVSARDHRRQPGRGAAAHRLGAWQAARVRRHRRAGPGRRVPGPHCRGAGAVPADHRRSRRQPDRPGRQRLCRAAGLDRSALRVSGRAIALARRVPMDTTYEPQFRAATALALAGAVSDADRWIARLRDIRPEDTLLHAAYMPVAQAAVLLARDRTDAAVGALRPAAPFERGTVAALLPIYFRGEARRRAARLRRRRHATSTSLIDSRGAEPFSSAHPDGPARAGTGARRIRRCRRQPARVPGSAGDVAGRRSRPAGPAQGAGRSRRAAAVTRASSAFACRSISAAACPRGREPRPPPPDACRAIRQCSPFLSSWTP